MVLIVEIEGVTELNGVTVLRALAAEDSDLIERNEVVVVRIEILHDSVKVLRRNGGVKGLENGVKLGNGDLAIVVSVESIEDFLELVRVLEVNRWLQFVGFEAWIGRHG